MSPTLRDPQILAAIITVVGGFLTGVLAKIIGDVIQGTLPLRRAAVIIGSILLLALVIVIYINAGLWLTVSAVVWMLVLGYLVFLTTRKILKFLHALPLIVGILVFGFLLFSTLARGQPPISVTPPSPTALVAGSTATSTPSPTSDRTLTSTPTATPTPTDTPTPTTLPTNTPTAISTPTPTPLPPEYNLLGQPIIGTFDPKDPTNPEKQAPLAAGRWFKFTGERIGHYCQADFPPNGLVWAKCVDIGQPPPTPTPTPRPVVIRTPRPTPPPFFIISPRDETRIGCGSQGPCLITVQVQWVPPTPTEDRRLYILVQPKPGSGFPWYVQPFPVHSGNGIWTANNVGIGFDDPAGTPFWVCALVTTTSLPDGAQLPDRPAGSLICVDVYR